MTKWDFKASSPEAKKLGRGITSMDSLCLMKCAHNCRHTQNFRTCGQIQVLTLFGFQKSPQESSTICSSQKVEGTQVYLDG